jgi:hypothetical protein
MHMYPADCFTNTISEILQFAVSATEDNRPQPSYKKTPTEGARTKCGHALRNCEEVKLHIRYISLFVGSLCVEVRTKSRTNPRQSPHVV